MSPREKLSAIQAVAGEVNQQFYGNTGVDEPELAMAVCEEFYAARAEEKSRAGKPDPVPVQAICDKLYGDMPHAREAFTKALAEHDITLDEPLPFRPRRCAVWKSRACAARAALRSRYR